MVNNSFLNIEQHNTHSQVIAHAGIVTPLATGILCCPFCGSTRDLRYTRRGDTTIVCGVCHYEGEQTTQSAFLAAQLREE